MADSKLTALSELSVPTLDDLAYIVDDPAGTPASYKVAQNRLGGMYSPATAQGRLTTESGVPVSTTDRTAQSTIYFTPYQGDRVALYDGTRWKLYAFTERSLALSSLTAAKPYDVFLYDNAGTLTLELTAWTSDTARATALVAQDGVWVKTGATTRRYVGTIYTTGTTTTEDSLQKRFVWTAALTARVDRPLFVQDSATHTYSPAGPREWAGVTTFRLHWVCGEAGGAASLIGVVRGGVGTTNTTVALAPNGTGVGTVGQLNYASGTGFDGTVTVAVGIVARLGYSYVTLLETVNGSGTWTAQEGELTGSVSC